MSNRFHNKFHRHNHHTTPTDRSGKYPDSAYDPLASPEAPFRGEFYVDGNITTLSSVSALGDLYASNGTYHEDVTIEGNLSVLGTTAEFPNIGLGEDNSVVILNSSGFLKTDEINPAVWDTTAKFISASDTDLTTGYIPKAGNIFGVQDSVIFDDGTNVGIGTNALGAKLTVSGTLSISDTATIGTIADNLTNTSIVVESNGLLQKRTLNAAAFDTTSRFVSASDTNLNVNYLTKATNSNGIDESIVFDDGTTVTAKGALSSTGNFTSNGTATIGTIADDLTNTSIVVENNGLLQKRTLNAAAFDTTSRFVSASDADLSVNYLTKATNSNGIDESIVFDDGTNVGIGETAPEGKLHVKSGSAGLVIAQTNSTGIFESSSNAYVSILSPNAQYAGVVMGGPGNPYGAYMSWNHDNNALKVATAHSGGAIQLLVNTEQEAVRILSGGNVGIGTTNPKEKLTVSGNLSTSGTATIGTIATDNANNSFVVETNGLLQKRTLNVAAGNTTATFVSASDGALSVNYLTKATDSNGIDDSIISDNGSLVYVGGNVTISGNLTALGNSYFANTLFTTTSSISVVNYGPGPAIYAYQSSGNQDIASFYDGDGVEVLHVGNCPPGELYGKVGINESNPNKELTVRGSVSASGTLNLGTINTNAASDSIVVLGTGNILEKRTIDSRAWGSSLVDGTGTANRVAYWTASNTIAADSDFFFDGTNVGIGTTSPGVGVKLDVAGTIAADYLRLDATDGVAEGGEIQLKGAGTYGDLQIDNHSGNLRLHTLGVNNHFQILGGGSTTALRVENGGAYIGSIATGTTDSVIIESSGTLQKRTIDSTAWNPGATYQPIITGAATTIVSSNLTQSMALVSDASGKVAASSITSTELGYLYGVTSLIQSQLDGKQNSWGVPFGTSTVTPAATTALPAFNDIILNNQTGPVTITAFSGGVTGVTYTITNESPHAVTLDTSASLFVRGGNSWSSHNCTTNTEGYIVLPQNFSCSLRMKSATTGSAW